MATKCNFQLSPVHPPIGTLIDGGSLELVEVLGVGGYGVVYRANETCPSTTVPKSYAVKCLVAPQVQNPRSRQVHIREIALHQLASRHSGVVTLHKVVECLNLTYIIMDYAPDHDLFTQILHSCRYLGDDALIRYVFLQLLDAVEYCHFLGIYHRDLKPENILCYDDGLRIAITDFGLATTEKVSDEFRTGSVFHMSPGEHIHHLFVRFYWKIFSECQGTTFAPQGNYSPMHNDIWSLGIILLNLATGRNPWKSATADDPTFQAYLRNPNSFLPSVLPISSEVNKILVGMLDIDYRRRLPLRQVKLAISQVKSFYSDGVIFEGSMARCPWESGMDIDTDSSEDIDHPAPRSPSPTPNVASCWSKETISDIIFARQPLHVEESTYDKISWNNHSSCGATWAYDSTDSSESSESSESEPGLENSDMFGGSRTPSETSIQSPNSSLPSSPNNADITFSPKAPQSNRKPLKINTNIPQPRFYDHESSIKSFSENSTIMQTAIGYDSYSSMFYLKSALSKSKVIALPVSTAPATAVTEDKEMTSPLTWQGFMDVSSPSSYSRASLRTSSPFVSPRSTNLRSSRTPMLSPSSAFLRSNSPSPETEWASVCLQSHQVPDNFTTEQSQHLFPVCSPAAMTDISSLLSPFSPSRQSQFFFPPPPVHTPVVFDQNAVSTRVSNRGTGCASPNEPKSRYGSLFGLKFFPWSPSSAWGQARTTQEKKSPATKVPSSNSTIAGTENVTSVSSGVTLGDICIEPIEQTSSSSCPDARANIEDDKTCRSFIACDKKSIKTLDSEGAVCGAGTGERRGEGKCRHDLAWPRTWEGGWRSKYQGSGTCTSQVDSSRNSASVSGSCSCTSVNEPEAHSQQNSKTSASLRQSRISVGRYTRRERRSRSPRNWFIPGRFFASAGAAAWFLDSPFPRCYVI